MTIPSRKYGPGESRCQSRDQIGVDFGRAGVSAIVAVTVSTTATVGTEVTDLFMRPQEVEPMTRQARLTLPQQLFDDLHHECIDLARERGLKRVSMMAVLKEAAEEFVARRRQRSRQADIQEQGA
jgi:hypothetical protein